MPILVKIRVNSENLNFIRKPVITSGDQNVVRCKFCFNEVWDGMTKKASFTHNNDAPVLVPIVNDECIIPYTVLSCKCKLYIGVIGEKDNKRITSHLLEYDVAQGAGGDSTSPTRQEVLEAAIKSYCDGQNYATKTYVDEHQCDCSDKDYATKTFVEDAVSVGIAQLELESDALNIVFCGGDANPETHYDDEEVLNYIFNGGGASGN